ncbi:MAG: isoleucyl-tRNA synthetase [Campylobacter sp.]|nr:isoleucyl-tRNA synthetase [Campylobacter sp.]
MKLLNALFVGYLFILALFFTFFVGLWRNYFDFYGVGEYFNAIFYQTVPFLWLIVPALLFGYFLLYMPFRKLIRFVFLLTLLFSLSTWHEKIGRDLGEKIFMSENHEKQSKDLNGNDISIQGRTIYKSWKYEYFLKDGDLRASRYKI